MTKIKNKQLVVTTDFDFLNNKLINLAAPSGASDAVNKEYVDLIALNNALQTGLYSGGTITISGASHFNVSTGIGYFVNGVTKIATKVTWSNQNYLSSITYSESDITISVGIDSSGNVFQQIPKFNEAQRRQYIILGEIFIHPTLRTLIDVAFIPVFSWDIPTVVDNYVMENDRVVEGNTITPNGANMMLDASSGKMLGYSINAKQSLVSPNVSNQINITGITFFPSFYDGVSEWIYTGATTNINPSNWSDGTLPLQPSTNNKFNLRVLFRSNGIGDVFFLIYPIQVDEYGSIADAEADILKISIPQPKELFGISVPLAWIIIKGNATNLSTITEARIIPIKNITTATGVVATLADDVSFDNTSSINLTSLNVNDVVDEVNNKIENLNFNINNKEMVALSGVSGQYLATNTTITDVPRTYVRVEVNSIEVSVGNGNKTAYCYFSNDGGTTAKTYTNIALGDSLYWNKSVAPYNLEIDDTIIFILIIF